MVDSVIIPLLTTGHFFVANLSYVDFVPLGNLLDINGDFKNITLIIECIKLMDTHRVSCHQITSLQQRVLFADTH